MEFTNLIHGFWSFQSRTGGGGSSSVHYHFAFHAVVSFENVLVQVLD
jgi:hypothetical protein